MSHHGQHYSPEHWHWEQSYQIHASSSGRTPVRKTRLLAKEVEPLLPDEEALTGSSCSVLENDTRLLTERWEALDRGGRSSTISRSRRGQVLPSQWFGRHK